MPKKYNTPHRSRVVKTRMTEEEYADFTERLQPYDMSQSEFIRQAISRAVIRPIVTVSPVNDELLSAIGELTAQYGKIGGNLNQIARTIHLLTLNQMKMKRETLKKILNFVITVLTAVASAFCVQSCQ